MFHPKLDPNLTGIPANAVPSPLGISEPVAVPLHMTEPLLDPEVIDGLPEGPDQDLAVQGLCEGLFARENPGEEAEEIRVAELEAKAERSKAERERLAADQLRFPRFGPPSYGARLTPHTRLQTFKFSVVTVMMILGIGTASHCAAVYMSSSTAVEALHGEYVSAFVLSLSFVGAGLMCHGYLKLCASHQDEVVYLKRLYGIGITTLALFALSFAITFAPVPQGAGSVAQDLVRAMDGQAPAPSFPWLQTGLLLFHMLAEIAMSAFLAETAFAYDRIGRERIETPHARWLAIEVELKRLDAERDALVDQLAAARQRLSQFQGGRRAFVEMGRAMLGQLRQADQAARMASRRNTIARLKEPKGRRT